MTKTLDVNRENLTNAEAAWYLNLCPSLLEKDRHDGRLGIPFVRIGRRVIYRRTDLDVFLTSRLQTPLNRQETVMLEGGEVKNG